MRKSVEELRKIMVEQDVHMVLIPTADYHESEYVADYFKSRVFMSGFTGSAGTLIVTRDDAGLWTDGRYFIQAENQLKDSGITLQKMGEENVLTVLEYIEKNLHENQTIAFDGRVVNTNLGREIEEIATRNHATVQYGKDLVDLVWKNRPALPNGKVFLLPIEFSGKEAKEKIADLRAAMAKKHATGFIDSSLDNIAWLFNIRGKDVEYNPVVLSYLLVTPAETCLYIDLNKLGETVRNKLREDGVTLKKYNEIYKDVRQFGSEDAVMLDPAKVNYRLSSTLKKSVKTIECASPIVLAKAIKNPVEIANLRDAHVQDGVACTRFMYWLKKNVEDMDITELSCDEKLTGFRTKQKGFIDKSFETIAGYNSNAAMMHYSASIDNYAFVRPEGMLLVDSGGQYWQGTTDITRTFACGAVTEKMRHDFTLVLKSNLQLARAKFLYGCNGQTLDILARGPLWNEGLDYKCGTGHGVGYLLNVHEGPHGFRWRPAVGKTESAIFEEGMVVTDEPGVYIEGEYGIRIENQMVCKKLEKNEYGQFMGFEVLTLCPIDLDLVDPGLLSKEDIAQLNEYHAMVYQKISSYLSKEEAAWLKTVTRAI